MTEADFSGKTMGFAGAQVLAAFMSTKLFEAKGSLSKLDLSKNELRSEGLSAVSEALKSTAIKKLNIAENALAFNQQHHKDMSGVIKFTEDMKDMGSLSSLILKGNRFANREAGAALGSMLKTCTSLTALDVSENSYYECDGPGFASEIASGLKDAKGSLSKLDLSRNFLATKEAGAALGAMLKTNTSLIALDLSNNFEEDVAEDGPGFASEIANGLEANGCLASLTISNNQIGSEQEAKIKQICAGRSIKFNLFFH
jgi:hypothetical protein